MLCKRFAALLALFAGFLGVVACLGAGYPVWLVQSRLDEANEKVFLVLEEGLAMARERVDGVQKRLRESKIRTGEIAQNIRDWSKSKATERLVSAAEIERKADKLTGYLQTTDQCLETLTDSIRGIQHFMELGALVGVPLDPATLENMIEEFKSIQGTVRETERHIDSAREFAAGRSEENRRIRVLQLLRKTELVTEAIGVRLEDAGTRLSEMQASTQRWKTRISKYIVMTTIGAYSVLAWIAAGQTALFLYGWKNCCRRGFST
jgi:hypothetical protein